MTTWPVSAPIGVHIVITVTWTTRWVSTIGMSMSGDSRTDIVRCVRGEWWQGSWKIHTLMRHLTLNMRQAGRKMRIIIHTLMMMGHVYLNKSQIIALLLNYLGLRTTPVYSLQWRRCLAWYCSKEFKAGRRRNDGSYKGLKKGEPKKKRKKKKSHWTLSR